MLTEHLLQTLRSLRLIGRAAAFEQQLIPPATHERLSFEERFGLLLGHEALDRDNRRVTRLLGTAKLRLKAHGADIDDHHPKPSKSRRASLLQGHWIERHQNRLSTGPTGSGQSSLACAFGDHACRQGRTTLYSRAPRLFETLTIAHADSSYPRLLASLARTELVILDDFARQPLTHEHRTDLLEILEDRHGVRSTLLTSQLPVKNWPKAIGDPTLSEAILDRLVHNAHKLELKGESMRKTQAVRTDDDQSCPDLLRLSPSPTTARCKPTRRSKPMTRINLRTRAHLTDVDRLT